jgi:dTDP-4-dehydrorhamnose 3,5-epimerase
MAEVVDLAVEGSAIEGLCLLTMKQVTDERGTVREFYRESAFLAAGLPSLGPWLQVNVTETHRGGLRGLHAEQMDKLVAVVAGEAFGAYVDTRPSSTTYGTVVTATLVPGAQILVPSGVANGFQATAPGVTQYLYCFDHEWAPGMAGVSCSPLDPELGIPWPLPVDVDDRACISAKDLAAPAFRSLPGARP